MRQVGHERPDLEELRENLVRDTGENKALLKQLEDTLLRVSLTPLKFVTTAQSALRAFVLISFRVLILGKWKPLRLYSQNS